MAKPKGYKRLLVFCLLVFTLCADTSFARRCGSRCGPSACRGGRGGSFYPFHSRFQFPLILIGFPYDYQYYDYNRYYSRYDNFPHTTGSRYDNFPYPSNYDNYQSRYDNFPYSSQAQSSPPQGNTYNYYTYNYYGGSEGSAAQYESPVYQRQLPQKTEVGIFYENGVTAFKNGNYAEAAKNFQRAIRPVNKFMPLAYTQALFADENYAQATEQLRLAIDKFSSENDSILFPGFLYPSNQILLTQIEKLRGQAGFDSDLQLLIGYQLFGVKKMDEAVKFLSKAKLNPVNKPAATKLLLMIEKTKTTTNRSQTLAYKT